ncbi:MAG: hypothetical protein WCE64_10500 [Bacteroidales bacterium]
MDIEKIFGQLGGVFLKPTGQIAEALPAIKAFIFDWDGVFNDGSKNGETGSSFSEVDSMGINLLRFSMWLRNGHIPDLFIITGMINKTAIGFAQREHFTGIYANQKNKRIVLENIARTFSITPDSAAFIFDDVIDFEAAKLCRLSFFVARKANPLLVNYVRENSVGNYISAFRGGRHAVREICELLTGLNGNYESTLENRIRFSDEYSSYLSERNKISTVTELHR